MDWQGMECSERECWKRESRDASTVATPMKSSIGNDELRNVHLKPVKAVRPHCG